MDRLSELKKLASLMIEFEKMQLGDDFSLYNNSEFIAHRDYQRVFHTLEGCNHYFHIIHTDLAQIISKENLLDKEVSLKYEKGLEVVKNINLFKHKYFKDIEEEIEM